MLVKYVHIYMLSLKRVDRVVLVYLGLLEDLAEAHVRLALAQTDRVAYGWRYGKDLDDVRIICEILLAVSHLQMDLKNFVGLGVSHRVRWHAVLLHNEKGDPKTAHHVWWN